MAAEVPESDLENDLVDVLTKHGISPYQRPFARYVIRQLDNFRESIQEINNDNVSNEGTMGSPS